MAEYLVKLNVTIRGAVGFVVADSPEAARKLAEEWGFDRQVDFDSGEMCDYTVVKVEENK